MISRAVIAISREIAISRRGCLHTTYLYLPTYHPVHGCGEKTTYLLSRTYGPQLRSPRKNETQTAPAYPLAGFVCEISHFTFHV